MAKDAVLNLRGLFASSGLAYPGIFRRIVDFETSISNIDGFESPPQPKNRTTFMLIKNQVLKDLLLCTVMMRVFNKMGMKMPKM